MYEEESDEAPKAKSARNKSLKSRVEKLMDQAIEVKSTSLTKHSATKQWDRKIRQRDHDATSQRLLGLGRKLTSCFDTPCCEGAFV